MANAICRSAARAAPVGQNCGFYQLKFNIMADHWNQESRDLKNGSSTPVVPQDCNSTFTARALADHIADHLCDPFQ